MLEIEAVRALSRILLAERNDNYCDMASMLSRTIDVDEASAEIEARQEA
jgi:hypothetical protein